MDYAGLIYCPCDAPIAPLRFVFAGTEFRLDGADLLAPGPEPACLLQIQATGVGWVLGDPFFRKFAVYFDFGRGRVGFAHGPATQSAVLDGPKLTAVHAWPLGLLVGGLALWRRRKPTEVAEPMEPDPTE